MAYDASYNSTFIARCRNWAKAVEDARREGASLQDIWNGLAVSSDPAFVEFDGITTTEVTSLITMLEHFREFIENETVTQGDRNAVLAPFQNE